MTELFLRIHDLVYARVCTHACTCMYTYTVSSSLSLRLLLVGWLCHRSSVLLDGTGHIKVTDFGFALPIPHGEKTYTVCGTPGSYPELTLETMHDSDLPIFLIISFSSPSSSSSSSSSSLPCRRLLSAVFFVAMATDISG